MRNNQLTWMARNAVIAALYAVITIAISPLSYGMMQIRISEVFMLLPFYNKRYIPGLVIGCALANLNSPLGIYDIAFGTLSTFVCCFVYRYFKNVWLGMLSTSIIGSVIVGTMLILVISTPVVLTYVGVAVGEFISLAVGVFLFKYILKNKQVRTFVFSDVPEGEMKNA